MQAVTFLFDQEVIPNYSEIKERISELLGEEIDAGSPGEDSFLVFHKQHAVEYSDGAMPAQTAFLTTDKPITTAEFGKEVEQSWSFPDASEVVSRSTFALSILEMMAHTLPPQVRLRLFHSSLQAAVESLKPIGMVFHHSCQVIDPKQYLASCGLPFEQRQGTVNVRFYNISNSDEDMIMDIRGLNEIDLPDLQCHFRNMNPDDIAQVLYNIAIYTVERGPVIESGQTVAGRTPEEKWVCQFEESMLEPKRTVLDINPGFGFAAGGR